MKNIGKIILLVALLCVVVLAFSTNASAGDDDFIYIPDKNLKAALIKAGIDIDSNGEIDKSEAYSPCELNISRAGIKDITGLEEFTQLVYLDASENDISDITAIGKMTRLDTLFLRDNNISSAAPLKSLKEATYINIDYNNISDLTPFLSMPKLQYLSVANNKLKTSVLAGTSSKTLDTLSKLQATLKSNNPDYGTVYGVYEQKMTYDASKISESAPTYKVLVAIVPDIDARAKVSDSETIRSKYKMSDSEIKIIKAYAKLFEKYAEKLSGYRFNVDLDIYVAKDKLKSLYAPAADMGLYEYDIFAPDVPELVSKINKYDTTITVGYLDARLHNSSGVAGFGWHSGDGKYYSRGVVFVPWDQYAYADPIFYTEEHAEQMCYDTLIDTFIHEFCHTLEQYAPLLGYNKIEEFHTALGKIEHSDDNSGAIAKYLQGGTYDDGLTGVPKTVFTNPPLKRYAAPKSVGSVKATAKSSDRIDLSWTKSSDADGYRIYIYKNGSSKYTMKTTTSTSIKLTSLSAGTEYKFAVRPYKYLKSEDRYIFGSLTGKVTAITDPGKVSSLKASSVSTSSMTLSWKSVKSATGYKISKYNSSEKKWETVLTTRNTSAKISKLSSASTYKFRVTAYRKTEKAIYYGDYVSLSVSTKPKAPTISSVKRSGTKLTVNLKKVTRADGYEVSISTDKNFKSISKRVISNKTTITLSGLKKSTKYYVRARSYYEVNGKRIYSSYTVQK